LADRADVTAAAVDDAAPEGDGVDGVDGAALPGLLLLRFPLIFESNL
jgi:hypothetical protein